MGRSYLKSAPSENCSDERKSRDIKALPGRGRWVGYAGTLSSAVFNLSSCHLTPPDSMIELNGGFLRLGAYRVEGVNTMYIGAGNPLGLLRQTGRWVNQNMSLNIIPLIEPLTEPSNRATELPTHRSRWLPISPIAPIFRAMQHSTTCS